MSIKRALISVYDKTGVAGLAAGLAGRGVQLISTGGTHRHLTEAGLQVTHISDVTGFPEILAGRVKTLHPAVHAGILARRDFPGDMDQLQSEQIAPIDLVVANLYPFQETVARPGVGFDEALENIDIGGPTMIRAAAKNHRFVLVVVNPMRYQEILDSLGEDGQVDEAFREALAREAFAHTAEYDAAICAYLSARSVGAGRRYDTGRDATRNDTGRDAAGTPFSDVFTVRMTGKQSLRYGENPHQSGAFYRDESYPGASIAGARQLHGVELSYNNIMDAAAALEMVREFERPAAAAVKHANPCGLAVADTLSAALQKAYESDPTSIFGGIVACNRRVDPETAAALANIFLHVVLAPSFDERALERLRQKKNLRLLELGTLDPSVPYLDFKRVPGGLLVQEADVAGTLNRGACRTVTEREPTEAEWRDLAFGWIAVKHVKSNAIVVAKDETTIGVGAGQMNRILPTHLALQQAGDRTRGAVLASDAFFPFPDVVEAAAAAGITAIVQPGGAKRDAESISAANEAEIAMVFTGVRHFRH